MRFRSALIGAGVAVFTVGLLAQTPPRDRPSFDVVSLKTNKSGQPSGSAGPQPGGRFVMVNLPLARLIQWAYPLQSSDLVGAPDWVRAERYDLQARTHGDASAEEIDAMLRSFLADRLKLQARVEKREQPVYELLRAREAPGLRIATHDCGSLLKEVPRSALLSERLADGAPVCGLANDGRRLVSGGITMDTLVRIVSPSAGRVVLDKTGLDGFYEFTLEFAGRPNGAAGLADDPADDRPSLFTALPEQLGLKLESARGAVDVLVIDHVERPTED